MARVVILGGSGYAGGAIAREAAGRGHDVSIFSRQAPQIPTPGVTSLIGSALVPQELERAIEGNDVVVVSLPPVGDLETEFERVNADIAELARKHGARLGVVGGAGTLLLEPEGGKIFESPLFPEMFRPFSRVCDAVLQGLRQSHAELDWFVLSPPEGFGSNVPGEDAGAYRVGGDVALSGGEGPASISGADYALAFVDELERPAHHRRRFTVAS